MIKENPYYRAMLITLDSLQWRGDKAYLRKVIRSRKGFMNLNDLFNTLSSIKIAFSSKTINFQDLNDSKLPCLFHLGDLPIIVTRREKDHFYAIDCTTNESLILPAISKRMEIYHFYRFDRREISPYDRQKHWFRRLFFRFKKSLTHILCISLMINILNLLAPFFIIIIFSQITAAKSEDRLSSVLFGITFYLGILVTSRLLRARFISDIAVRVGYIISTQVMRRILLLPSSYTESAHPNSQLTRLRDFESIQKVISSMLMDTLLDLPFTIILIVGLWVIAGPLAGITLLAIAVFSTYGFYIKKKVELVSNEANVALKERNDIFFNTVQNIQQLQEHYLYDFWQRIYTKSSLKASTKYFHLLNLNNQINTTAYFIVQLFGFAGIALGVELVLEHKMGSAQLMAAMLLIWKILTPVKGGFTFISQIDKFKKSIAQIDRLMDLPQEDISEDALEIDQRLIGKIRFEQVSFKYKKEAHPALLGINIEINIGSIVLLEGHGGSGQTTVFKLLMGLYYPQAGRVLIDNKNTRQINPMLLRGSIAYLPATPPRFSTSIRKYMETMAQHASTEQIFDVLEQVQLDETVRDLSRGIDTVLDEKLVEKLGEGFIRQLGFAVLLLKDVNIWLLDNPFSSQQEGLNQMMVRNIERFRGTKTIIISTKTYGHLVKPDKTYHISDGRIVNK